MFVATRRPMRFRAIAVVGLGVLLTIVLYSINQQDESQDMPAEGRVILSVSITLIAIFMMAICVTIRCCTDQLTVESFITVMEPETLSYSLESAVVVDCPRIELKTEDGRCFKTSDVVRWRGIGVQKGDLLELTWNEFPLFGSPSGPEILADFKRVS